MIINKIVNKLQTIRHFSNSKPLSQKTLRIFSGIQPTGALHLGNYFGAIRQWIEYQNNPSVELSIYSIVDLHSLTTIQNKQLLNQNIKQMIASLLGCGLDPNKSIIYQQSVIPFHGQLSWILATVVTMAQLSRFPQFKERTEGMTEIPLGLYLYPVLQVADILLYKSNCVPVGDDQLPHMNFAKHLSSKFNNTFSKIFPIPETICNEFSGRIKSLRNPEKKMSKSELDMKSRIEIIDSADEIRLKCKRAVTDMISEVTFDPISRPGVSNLVLIYSLISGLTPEQVCEQSVGLDTGKFKLLLSDLVVEHFKPIREEVMRLMNEDLYLHQVLSEGSNKALQIAENTMNEVYEAIGFKF